MNWQFQSFEMSAKFHLYPVAKGAIWLAEYVSVKLKNDEQMVLIIWDVSKIPFVSFRESCDVIGSAREFAHEAEYSEISLSKCPIWFESDNGQQKN